MRKPKEYRSEKIEYTKPNGFKVRGRLYLPLDEEGIFRTAIFCHGFRGCYREIMHYGPMFAQAGLALCVFDFCGGGPLSSSDGPITEMTLLTELDELMLVLKEIKKHPQVDENNIFLMGESQGGCVAALAGARYPEESRGLVLWYPALCMLRHVIALVGEEVSDPFDMWGMTLGRIYLEDLKSVDVYKEISGYTKELLIVQGDLDPIVPMADTMEAMDIFPNAKLKVIEGGGHGFEGDQTIEAGSTSINYILNYK